MVAKMAAFLNSGLNPVIYSIRLQQFKDAFRELFHMEKKREETLPPGEGILMIETLAIAHNAKLSFQNDHEQSDSTN